MSPTHRRIVSIDRDWKFHYDPATEPDLRCAELACDDRDWRAVALPHTWSTYETTGDLHPFIRDAAETDNPYWWHGWGWYRKRLRLDERCAADKWFLEFDGVGKYCQVFVNGQLAGEHEGGFTSFSLDITDYLTYDGQDNLIAVAVSNRRDDPRRIPPMTAGNWDVYGGIYRPARLVGTDRVYIPFQGAWDHEGGTFVTTPVVYADRATVRVRTWVRNEREGQVDATVATTIVDREERPIAQLDATAPIPSGETACFDQTTAPIADPHLWCSEDPYLYQVRTRVLVQGVVVDHWTSPLGLRWFHWDYDEKRLHLNGQRVHIHGTNRHQEYPWLGDAIPLWLHEQDLRDIRFRLGHNFIRGCHYPQDPLFYELCDRYGLMVCEEVPNIKNIRFSDRVQRQNVIEMIRRDRNHPSILMWSMGNETTCAADGDWARAEDDTRIIHFRHVTGRGEWESHNADQIDMENLLRCTVRGWYDRDERDAEPSPAEYGSSSGQIASTETWQHRMARVDGGSQRGRIDGNIVVWLYNDHGADREYRDEPLLHVNPKGWVDAYRMPKYMYYLWQANYCDYAMVFIHPHYWREAYLGQRCDIVVDSNGEQVELFIDDALVGMRQPQAATFHTVTFEDVPIRRGTLKAIARKNGQWVSWCVPMAGEPARLTLSTEQPQIAADRSGIALIVADIVDADGHHVYGARHTLRWSVDGPATLVGPPTYVSDFDQHEAMEGTMYIDAPVAMPIRATAVAGPITVRVEAEGLEAAEIVVQAVAPAQLTSPGIVQPTVADGAENRRPAATVTSEDAHGPASGELPIIYTDIELPPGDAGSYRAALIARTQRVNPAVDVNNRHFQALLDEWVALAVAGDGRIIADDYDFAVRRYNKVVRGD